MDFEDQDEHDEEEEEVGGGLQPEFHDTMNSKLKMSEPNIGSVSTPLQRPKYKECLKNHAVGLGGHATDGCGEFLPAGPEGSLDALKCAACNCHRNFHRKDSMGSPPFLPHPPSGELFLHHNFPQFAPYYRSPTGYVHVAAAHRPLALPSTSGGHSREDQEDGTNHDGSARKRFRTKFTQEQKEKMLGLAERLGWRIQKHDEGAVNEFCNETGIKKHVLKVWMHNNKHTLGKKP